MVNTKRLSFSVHTDGHGDLVALEENNEIPFEFHRVYYIYHVDDVQVRGRHAHRDLQQVLICVHGSLKVKVKNPYEEEVYFLNNATEGLYIGDMLWREMYDFSDDAVLLVIASKPYSEKDYFRDYPTYEREAISFFNKMTKEA